MRKSDVPESKDELSALCCTVRELVRRKEYRECELIITKAMMKYPHAPEPHNLIGILLENEGDHLTAMKHFRAAWSLNPAYIPVRYNLDRFGSIFSDKECVFDETDCPEEPQIELYKTVYDESGTGHIVKRD